MIQTEQYKKMMDHGHILPMTLRIMQTKYLEIMIT